MGVVSVLPGEGMMRGARHRTCRATDTATVAWTVKGATDVPQRRSKAHATAHDTHVTV